MKKTAVFVLLLTILLSACAPTLPATPETTPSETNGSSTTPSTTEDEPMESLYPVPESYTFYRQEAEKLIDLSDNPHYSLSGDSSDYAWGTSYAMQGLYTAYRVTKNTDFLDTYAQTCHNLLATLEDGDQDGFLGWDTAAYSEGVYEEFVVHTGLAMKGLADFVLLVQSDVALAARQAPGGESLGDLADRILQAVDAHLVPAFERDFSAAFGIYMNRPGSGNYSGATGVYSLPHNQYLTFSTALYTLALVSPENAGFYLGRADAQARVFKNWLRIKDDGFVNWHYDDTFHFGDHDNTMSEDYSHGMIDYQAAAEAYHRGLYTIEDMALFADNLTGNMFHNDWENPKIAFRVSGGRRADFSGDPYIYHMLLSPFGEAVWPLCEAAYAGRTSDAALLLAWHPAAEAPGAFALTAPAQNAAVAPDKAVFIWEASQNAADYTLEIAKTADFATPVVRRPYIAAVGAMVDDLEENTGYFWRVSARNGAGETVYSDVSSFTTGARTVQTPKILTFSYRAETDQPYTGRSVRVYFHRELAAEIPLSSDQWQEFSIDLTEKIGFSSTAGIKIGLYSDHAKPAGEVLHLANISLSGSVAPNLDVAAENAVFFIGSPMVYARRGKSGVFDGDLRLGLPLYDEVKIFESYAGTGKIVNEAAVDFGFVFPK